MKIKYLIVCFVASLLASCGEIDESNLKLYPSKLYLGVSGYNLQEIYDLGEESLVWDVYVDKSGYYDNAAEVELSYDPTVLTDYQELTQEGLDFEVLPEHVGTLGQKRLSLAADATLGGTQLTFDMTTLRTLIPKDEEVKYVYPVRIKSLTEGVEVNTDKDYLLLAIRLNTPQANLRGRGSLIKGLLVEATPAYAVIECGGVGYYINISVNTYSQIVALQQVSLYIHQIVREDALLLYGFFNKEERTVFRQLISVSGIGANTASVMLSSMTVKEIAGAILTENVNAIKSVKGIGLKTAQRVIIELKDKIAVTGSAEEMNFGASVAIKEEALAALVMLGFVKAQANKVLDKIMAGGGVTSVEELIKQALKQL